MKGGLKVLPKVVPFSFRVVHGILEWQLESVPHIHFILTKD